MRIIMIKKSKIILLALLTTVAVNIWCGDKYAGEIFRMGASIRNYAMGNTGVTDTDAIALAYWNPSLIKKTDSDIVEVLHSEEFNGAVKFDMVSGTLYRFGELSYNISRIAVDDVPLTRVDDPSGVSSSNRPYKYKSVSDVDYIVHLGIKREMRNIPIGITTKIIHRSIAEKSGYGFGFDISTHKQLNERVLLGINLRDAVTTRIFWENGTQESVTPNLDIGLRYQFPIPILNRKGNIYISSDIYFEGREESSQFDAGAFSGDYHLGFSAHVTENVELFTGKDLENITAGLSISIKQFNLNYSYENDSELENSHRISLAMKY